MSQNPAPAVTAQVRILGALLSVMPRHMDDRRRTQWIVRREIGQFGATQYSFKGRFLSCCHVPDYTLSNVTRQNRLCVQNIRTACLHPFAGNKRK